MTLATLIQKGGLRQVATATSAIPATHAPERRGSLATVATVAVADPPSTDVINVWCWRVQYPGLPTMEVLFHPEASRTEVAAIYPGARIEPVPDVVTAALEPAPLDYDDRRTCRQCANLSPNGRCRAATRGELPYVANKRYEPVRDLSKRCGGYEPTAADPDQRPGAERWPDLTPNP